MDGTTPRGIMSQNHNTNHNENEQTIKELSRDNNNGQRSSRNNNIDDSMTGS
jgi:hypothetical protein